MHLNGSERENDLHFLLMVGLMFLIGIMSAIAVLIFNTLLGFFQNLFFLGHLGIKYYEVVHIPSSVWGIGIILVPVIGGLFVIWLIEKFAAKEKGLGVPYVMYAMRWHLCWGV